MSVRRQGQASATEVADVNLNIRISSDLRDRAKAKAAERGETLSAAVVDLLRGYVEQP